MLGPVVRPLLALCLACTTGCAAILKGDYDTIEVLSDPAEAEVLVDGVHGGTTPGGVKVLSREAHELVLRSPGHRDQSVFLEPDLHEGYLALDLVLLLPGIIPGVVALIVDGSTGSWYTSEPAEISAVLIPEGPAPEGDAEAPAGAATPTPTPETEASPDEEEDVPPAPPPFIPDDELPPPPPES